MIMRAFYETRHIIFMDAILRHSAYVLHKIRTILTFGRLTDEQTALLMGIPIKECRFIAGKLREDRLLAMYVKAIL